MIMMMMTSKRTMCETSHSFASTYVHFKDGRKSHIGKEKRANMESELANSRQYGTSDHVPYRCCRLKLK